MSEAVITGGQARAIIGSFVVDTPWNNINVDLQPFIELPPEERGKRFAAFLQNGCRVNIGGLIVRTAPLGPEKFVGLGWEIITEEQDARSAALAEVDFSQADSLTCLNPGETSITGEKKLRRLKASGRILYGASVFHGLWLDHQAKKENSVLEVLYRLKNLTYLDFFGDVLQHPDGFRHVLWLYRHGGEWHWDVGWLGRDWLGGGASAVSQIALFLLCFGGGVLFLLF